MEFNLLIDLLANLKKSPGRTYSKNYIELKNREINEVWLEIKEKITDEKALEEAKSKFQELRDKINSFLIVKETSDIDKNSTQTTMASFDIAAATKIIPEFDGDFKTLSNFLGLIEFYKESLKADQENILLRFITTVKLSDRVKNRLLSENSPTSLAELKTNLQKSYKTNKNPIKIHKDLAMIQQGNQSVNAFASRIESLIASLNDIQVTEQGESNRALIVKMNDQLGLSSFKNGINEPYKSILTSARPSKLSEAITITAEIADTPKQTNMYHYKQNHNSEYRYRDHRYNNNNRYGSSIYKNKNGNYNRSNNNGYNSNNNAYNNNRYSGYNRNNKDYNKDFNNRRGRESENLSVPGRQDTGGIAHRQKTRQRR